MKTMIERGKAVRKSPLINFNMVELAFRMMKIPGVARRHSWSRGDLNNMRFLPVNEEIEAPEGFPLPIELLYRLIDEASYRVVIDYCFCRRGCDCKTYPVSTGCLVLGAGAKQIATSVRREVGVEEARRHTDDAVATGLVPFIGKIRLDNLLYGIKDHGRFLTVCFCCECCCVSRFTQHIPIADLEPAYTRLPGVEVIVSDECVGCGECVEGCFMNAISVEGGKAVIGEYCRACGRCATVCPSEALEVRLTDPAFLEEAYRQISGYVNIK
jgi:UDP-glucose 4-epimerase